MAVKKHQEMTKWHQATGWLLRGAAAGVAMLVLQACTTGATTPHWQLVEERSPQLAPEAEGSAPQPVAVVFYRELGAETETSRPINIYINGQYQASLVGNTYTEQMLCPGEQQLMVAFNDVSQRYVNKEEGWVFDIDTRPIQYFRVADDGAGGAVISQVDGETAEAAKGSLQERQVHTISRVVNRGCGAR